MSVTGTWKGSDGMLWINKTREQDGTIFNWSMNTKLDYPKKHPSQRGWFAYELYQQMEKDPDIWLVVGDLGYAVFDQIKKDFPDRFINVGAAEQSMMGVAVGLALKGKKVFTYTISSFYLRCAETISLYLDGEQIPVFMVGSGIDDDYKHDGSSHNGTKAQKFIESLSIHTYYPKSKEHIPFTLEDILKCNKPASLASP